MKKITKLFALLITGLSLLAVSCNGFNTSKNADQGIALRFNEARTILPNAQLNDFDYIEVVGIDENENSILLGEYNSIRDIKGFIPVKVGTWNVVVTAYIGNTVFVAKEDNVVVNMGEIIPIDIVFEYSEYADPFVGYGNINLVFSFPGNDIYKINALITDYSGSIIYGEDLYPVDNKVQLYYSDIDSGYYYVVLELLSGNDDYSTVVNTYRELVIVADGCESYASRKIDVVNTVYYIDYELNGGDFDSSFGVSIPGCFTTKDYVSLPNYYYLHKDYYNFGGWYTDPDFAPESLVEYWNPGEVAENLTLYAKWNTANFLVKYDCNDGTLSSGETSFYINIETESFDLPTADEIERRGYSFGGWYTTYDFEEDSAISSIDTSAPEAYTLYAKWIPNRYPIIYDVLNESGMDEELLEFKEQAITYFEYGKSAYIVIPEASYPGYLLTKWTVIEYDADNNVLLDYGDYYPGETFIISDIANFTTDKFVIKAVWDTTPVTISYETAYCTAPEAVLLHSNTVLDAISEKYLTDEQLPIFRDEDTGFFSLGWYVEGDELKTPVTTTTSFAEDTKLIAYWKNRYTVSYSSDYGTVPESFIVEDGTTLNPEELTDIYEEDTGFVSLNWYVEGDLLKEPVMAGTAVTENLLLVANWKTRYTITYDTGSLGIITIPSKVVEEGTVITSELLPIAGYSGNAISGWFYKDDVSETLITSNTETVTQNITLKAIWAEAYKITYISERGETPAVTYIPKDTYITEEYLPVLFDDPMVHKGWLIDDVLIIPGTYIADRDLILTAYWYDMCTIYYETAYGTRSSVEKDLHSYIVDSDIEPVIEASTGYESLFWYKKGDLTKTPVTTLFQVNQDITLVAEWKPRYTVSYETENGTAPDSIEVEEGTKLTKENLPTVELLSNPPYFTGWFIGTDKVSSGYEVLSDVTLTAGWIDSGCPISYNSEYGTTPTDISVIPETVLGYDELPILEEPGRFFVGWFDAAGNYYDPENNEGLTDPVELTAKWAEFGVRYVLDSNSSMSGTITSLKWPNYTVKLESTHGNISSISASYKKENIAKYEYLISSTTGEGSSSWSSNITLYNNSSERCTVVVSAVPQLLNEGGVPYDITDTTKATSLSGFMMMRTDSSNFTRAMYAFNVVAGTKYRVQWVDSFSYDNDSSWDFYASMPAGLCDQYIYIHSEDGSISKSSDDPTYLEFTATTDTVIYVISAGRGNTGLTYIQPYVIE